MIWTLRALERKLVFERAELGVGLTVYHLLTRWDLALHQQASTPDAIDFAADLLHEGFYLPTVPKAIKYLEECGRNGSLPDRRRLTQVLLPWCTWPPAHHWDIA